MKTDSGLIAYCHGNADFPNVWERCWPTTTIPIYKGAKAPSHIPLRIGVVHVQFYHVVVISPGSPIRTITNFLSIVISLPPELVSASTPLVLLVAVSHAIGFPFIHVRLNLSA